MIQPFARDESRDRHLEQSFVIQRYGMAILAFFFPIVFLVSSFLLGRTEFQTSLSAYYWTLDPERNLFVGVLVAVGVFLVLYKGHNWKEDRIIDLAGVCAVGVAFVPMSKLGDCVSTGFSLHGTFAAIFFACITYICVFMSEHTLPDVEDPDRRAMFRSIYRGCGIVMVASVIVGLVMRFLPEDLYQKLCRASVIFWAEAFGIWAFSVFWYVKTRELDPTLSMIPFMKRSG